MEDLILYYQNRVLKKRVALAELMDFRDPTPLVDLIDKLIEEMNGKPRLSCKEITDALHKKLPTEDRNHLAHNVSQRLYKLAEQGVLERAPGGGVRKPQNENPVSE